MMFSLLAARKAVRLIPPVNLRLLVLRAYLGIWAAVGCVLVFYAIFRSGPEWYLVWLIGWLVLFLFIRPPPRSTRRWAFP